VDRWRKWLDDDQRQGVMSVTADWAAFFGYGADPGSPLERLTPDPAGSRRLVTGPDLAGRRSAFPGLDWSPPEHPRNDRPILPRGPRNRRRALRGPGGSSEDAARQLLERLPPGMQRAVRDARRGRRSRPPD
jgi:hypothetical protein